MAIVADWMVGGGAELVVEQLSKMYSDAPIFTSYCTDEWRNRLGKDRVQTGILQIWPFPKIRKFIPLLRALWFSQLNLSQYDLVISSSGAEAKFVKHIGKARHISYIHAPTHYYWDRYEAYVENPGFGKLNWLARFGLRFLVGPMRKWDYKAAQRPDILIANSTHTQTKIRQYYSRDSVVIYPPVDIGRFSATSVRDEDRKSRRGFVVVGRQVPYKKIDLAIRACSDLELPLTVIGNGPEHDKLVEMAGPSVRFMPNASDVEIAEELGRAEALIFPGEDDFGIVMVEALASGCPVIAYRSGGALDIVVEAKNGVFFNKLTVKSLKATLKNFNPSFSAKELQSLANQFSAEEFIHNYRKVING